MMSNNNAKIIVVSAPSGCGKGTVLAEVFKDVDVFYSVSCTTREPREGEVNGKTYHFISDEQFEKMINDNAFLEYAGYTGHYYGTPKQSVEDNLAAGKDVVLEIETQGAFQVKKLVPGAVLLFILPPSVGELSRRLHKRGTEDEKTIIKRVSQAAGEIGKSFQYDYVIMNDDLDDAVRDFKTVLESVKNNSVSADRFKPENEEIKNMIRGVLDNA